MTVFHLFAWAILFGSTLAGAADGRIQLGWPGLALGASAGFVVGYVLARVILALSWWPLKRFLTKSDSATLRTHLDDKFFIAHFVIAELLQRGEPIESFRDFVAGLLGSGDRERREVGEFVTKLWPETAPAPHQSDSTSATIPDHNLASEGNKP